MVSLTSQCIYNFIQTNNFMKYILLCCLLIYSVSGYSQNSFVPHNITFGAAPRALKLIDVDFDSDLDIVVYSQMDHMVAWHRNNGSGLYDTVIACTNPKDFILLAEVADINNDGLVDIITGESHRLSWYQNLGNGNFNTAQLISSSVNFDQFSCIYAADLDNDTLIDIVSASNVDGSLSWFKNDGNGIWSSQQIISNTAFNETTSVYVEDLNQDGDLDIVFASSSWIQSKIAWHENLGGGVFGTQQIVDSSITYWTFSIKTADINNDSLPDIISSNSYKCTWYQNFGNGNFSSENIINSNVMNPKYFDFLDIDSDNDLDIVITNWGMDSLLWQENLGNGLFGSINLVSDSIDGPYGISTGDVDQDGDVDFIVSSEQSSNIISFFNRGSNFFEQEQTIEYACLQVMDVFTYDVNSDGLLDILAASKVDNKISWYQNAGNKQFSLQKIISNDIEGAVSVNADDLNGDGLNDILAGGWTDSIYVFHNSSDSSLFDVQSIQSANTGQSIIVKSADIDGDSLIDIISCINNWIVWSKNLGNGYYSPVQNLYYLSTLSSFDLQDVNNDTLVDIIFGNAMYLGLGLNQGNGIFAPVQYLNQFKGANDLQIVDLDSDGDYDIIYTVFPPPFNTDPEIGWYENLGSGIFSSSIFLSYIDDLSTTIAASDIDKDGDMDIIAGLLNQNFFPGNLIWLENLGGSTFNQAENLLYNDGRIHDLEIADLDNDGDDDIVLGLRSYINSVKWLENTLYNILDTFYLCTGDSALIFGDWHVQPGSYYDTLQNGQGGDSIIIVVLENYQSYFVADTVEICEGDFYNFNGQILTAPGSYFASLQSNQGCDSIVELPLSVIPLPTVNINPFYPDSVCIDSGLISLPIGTPQGGSYSGIGVVGSEFDPTISGIGEYWITYAFTDTITGCSNLDSTSIIVYNSVGINEIQDFEIIIYPNPGKQIINVEGTQKGDVIRLHDLYGNCLLDEINQTKSIEIKQFAQATYILTIERKGIVIRKLFIKID